MSEEWAIVVLVLCPKNGNQPVAILANVLLYLLPVACGVFGQAGALGQLHGGALFRWLDSVLIKTAAPSRPVTRPHRPCIR